MKKFTKIEVSFMDDFVPFLRKFNRDGIDVATIFYRNCVNNLPEADNPDAALRIHQMLSSIDPVRWVAALFVWSDSTDGANFWENIDTKWRQFLHSEEVGQSNFVGMVTLSDIQSLIPESIQGKYYTVKDLSYNRPVEKEFESYTWNNRYVKSELAEVGGKYLVLSDYPESKVMKWLGPGETGWPRPMIKVWIPELNRAWWVFFSPINIHTK